MPSWNAKPSTAPSAAVSTIAFGVTISALVDSSARWKGASKPDMIQIAAMKLMRTAIPSGQSVMLVMPHACAFELNFGRPCSALVLPPKKTTQQMKRNEILSRDVNRVMYEIHLTGIEAMQAQLTVMDVASRNACHLWYS
ncbi:hypothetical protein OGATHE_002244 [Ogataea polymorpha]|uniref:Uncharacterized protein n=1 Tax=Ogataea polymorpha TaxID=460523 RepID=A0A9P8PJS7_9ASCO|nr:hypothetical protein OGATHE_002244 [Ogataea polymorpha]